MFVCWLRIFVCPGFVTEVSASGQERAAKMPAGRGRFVLAVTSSREAGRQTPPTPRRVALSGETPSTGGLRGSQDGEADVAHWAPPFMVIGDGTNRMPAAYVWRPVMGNTFFDVLFCLNPQGVTKVRTVS